MKIIGKCGSCKKTRAFVRKRRYNVTRAGLITSQNELCGKCFEGIKITIKDQLI